MSQKSDRQSSLGDGTLVSGDRLFGIIAKAGMIGGAICFAAKTLTDSYNRVREDDGDSMPLSVQHQILAASHNLSTKNDGIFTMDDLEDFARQYMKEITIAVNESNFERLGWLSDMQKRVKNLIDVRNRLNEAQRIGDCVSVSSLTPHVQKMQQDLAQRRSKDVHVRDDREHQADFDSSDFANNDEVGHNAPADIEHSLNALSRNEVLGIIASFDTKLKAVDLEEPGGVSRWLKLNAAKTPYQEMANVFQKIEEASHSHNDKNLRDHLELMKALQQRQEAMTKEPVHVVPKQGVYESLKNRLGWTKSTNAENEQAKAPSEKPISSRGSFPRKRKATTPEPEPREKSIASSKRSTISRYSCRDDPIEVLFGSDSEESLLEIDNGFHPTQIDELCPTLFPWHTTPWQPRVKEDLSDAALAFTAPMGAVVLPDTSLPVFANLDCIMIEKFVQTARDAAERSPSNLQQLLPAGCTLNEDQARHLFRNFSDTRIVTHGLSRREFDIFVFCKRRAELSLEGCHGLMTYRDIQDVKTVWDDLFSGVDLVSRMSEAYRSDLSRKVGLLAQLEGLLPSVTTSRGRVVLPPLNFIAEPGSSQGSIDTFVCSTQTTCESVMTAYSDEELAENEIDNILENTRGSVCAEPCWPAGTAFEVGSFVQDQEHRMYYVTRENDTFAVVAKKRMGDAGSVNKNDITNIIKANAAPHKLKESDLKPSTRFKAGTVLILPPHTWPMRLQCDEDDDDYDGDDDDDKKCDVCGSPAEEEKMLLCDQRDCTVARHVHCCDPPLSVVPLGCWFCSKKCSSEGALLFHDL